MGYHTFTSSKRQKIIKTKNKATTWLTANGQAKGDNCN